MVEFDLYNKQAMVYHLGEHKCHPKLYVLKDRGPHSDQSPTSLHSVPAGKKAVQNVAQKILQGDTDGAEKECDLF